MTEPACAAPRSFMFFFCGRGKVGFLLFFFVVVLAHKEYVGPFLSVTRSYLSRSRVVFSTQHLLDRVGSDWNTVQPHHPVSSSGFEPQSYS